jgi:hypothetical protein
MKPAHAAQAAPVIFLDIDGVLAVRSQIGRQQSRAYTALRKQAGLPAHMVKLPTRRAFVPRAVAALNALCIDAGALLVLSSSWRLREGVQNTLHLAGVEGPFHPDWRTDSAGPSRADEIQRWLAGHDARPFVILDDWPAQLAGMLGRTVVPNFQIGLTAQDSAGALAILAATT